MNTKLLRFIAILAIAGFVFMTCKNSANSDGDYKIGDTGPGGGKVFYDKGSVSNGWRYLEAAPINQGTKITWCTCTGSPWCNVDTVYTENAIGTGKANTDAIIAAHSGDTASNNAAKAAVAYTGGGKDDWFLPSIKELIEMHINRSSLGISSGEFLSSTESQRSNVWTLDFGSNVDYDIGWDEVGKDTKLDVCVRAVRAF